jgi:hypothetical protein
MVFGDVKEFQVLKAIVSLDAVSMVNVFARLKIASEMLTHDETVFSDIPSVTTDIHIAANWIDKSSAGPCGVVSAR